MLERMRALTGLKELLLQNASNVTDDGMKQLKRFTGLKKLTLRYAWNVSDDGLKHLEGLTSLEELLLHDTQVTDEGVKKLQEALPDCKISH
jgi:hypothetical protein